MCAALSGHMVKELVPKDRPVLPVANDDDTVLEIAAMMAANRSPLVAVLDGKGKDAALLGAISISDLLSRVLPRADQG
jgi:CBS domain-containing protein